MKANEFKLRLRSILADNAERVTHTKLKAGTIDVRRLSKLGTSSRLFKKPSTDKKGKRYDITLLVDASGSMEGSKQEFTKQALAQVMPVLATIKELRVQIYAFNAVLIRLKGYDEKYDPMQLDREYDHMLDGQRYRAAVSMTDIIACIDDADVPAGYIKGGHSAPTCHTNLDGLCLAMLAETLRLEANDITQQVVLVFSDGQPSSDNCYMRFTRAKLFGRVSFRKYIEGSGSNMALRRAIRLCDDYSIKVVSIGIQSDSVKEFYRYAKDVWQLNELYPAIIGQLAKVMQKV